MVWIHGGGSSCEPCRIIQNGTEGGGKKLSFLVVNRMLILEQNLKDGTEGFARVRMCTQKSTRMREVTANAQKSESQWILREPEERQNTGPKAYSSEYTNKFER